MNTVLSKPNRGGRPPGAINRATRELKEFWHLFFTSAEYRAKAKQRILDGSAPHLESYLLNRIYGRPKEQVEVSVAVTEDLSQLSIQELTIRAAGLLEQLREAQEAEVELQAHNPQLLDAALRTIDVEPVSQEEPASEGPT